MKHAFVRLSAIAAVTLACASAAGEEKSDKQVITLKVTDVYGRAQRPAAAVEVSKVRMQLPATTPTLAALSKIDAAAKKDPF